VHVDVDRATAIARATARTLDPTRVSDADATVAAARHDAFVPPTPAEGHVVRVDGTQPAVSNVHAVLTALLAVRH
jgi:hypothetical protein